ncbi:MAG TPA: TetR/AcrR family transcriptional regulator [Actinocrinis sp.]|nr:TetR/AcrR family transcriptional regulator [Actinocrinis sp.]
MTAPPAEPRRGRGRPREVVRRTPGKGMPLGYRAADYPPTTRAILDAAHRVLLRDGVRGLTMVAVAREAHVDVTTVSYHFSTRNGLIEALMDRLYADNAADFAAAARNLTEPQDRWHSYLQSVRQMYDDHDATRAYFDIAALALRDPALRLRLARLNSWTIDTFIDAIGVEPDPGIRALAELVFAAIDGVELHHALAGDDYPLAEVLGALETLMLQAQRDPPAPDAD